MIKTSNQNVDSGEMIKYFKSISDKAVDLAFIDISNNNNIYIESLLSDTYRALKDDSYICIVVDDSKCLEVETSILKAGFSRVYNNLSKVVNLRFMDEDKHLIIGLKKGGGLDSHNLDNINIQSNAVLKALEPLTVLEFLIINLSRKDDAVLALLSDGVNVTCECLDRKFIRVELDKEYYDIEKKGCGDNTYD